MTTTNNNTFQQRLAAAILESGISITELSERAGLNRSTIQNYMNGKFTPRLPELEKLAEALGVSVQWLRMGQETDNAALDLMPGEDSLNQVALFKDRLREAMESSGFPHICDLAHRTGLAPSVISRYLNGTTIPRYDNANNIAATLGVSTNWLMGYDVAKERNTAGKDQYLIQILTKMSDEGDFLEVISSLSQLNSASYSAVRSMIQVLAKEEGA